MHGLGVEESPYLLEAEVLAFSTRREPLACYAIMLLLPRDGRRPAVCSEYRAGSGIPGRRSAHPKCVGTCALAITSSPLHPCETFLHCSAHKLARYQLVPQSMSEIKVKERFYLLERRSAALSLSLR